MPATLIEREQLAVGRSLAARRHAGGRAPLHPVGEAFEWQPEAERALGERLGVRRAELAAVGGGELDGVAFAHDARDALAHGRGDEHLVAGAGMALLQVSRESVLGW